MESDTQSALLRRYYDLRTYLGIDLLELDRAYMQTPRILQEAGELSAEADATEMTARHTYDIIKAEAGARIRSVLVAGKEPSEARIDKLLPLEPEVQDARVAHDKARYEAQICQILYRSLDTQSRILGKASDMVMGGYVSPSAAYARDQRHSDIRRAQVEADAQTREKERHGISRPTD